MLEYSTIVLGLFLVLTLYGFAAARQYLIRQKTIHERGCQPPRSVPQKDPLFGLDVAFRMFKSYGEGQRSTKFKEQHEAFGSTFQSVALGKTRIFTIDPENLRAIFATDFKNWGVQSLRLPSWEPFLGKGVMDTDGAFWRHSRDMVQPLFRREQISDLASFDVHVTRFLDLIPKDESMVDLQPLFARLILDFTTDFLFGESVECLTSAPNKAAMAFLEAFHYGQAGIGKRTQLPYWTVFTHDKKFWQAAKITRDFVDEYVNRAIHRRESPGSDKRRRYILADELVKQTKDKQDIRNQLLNTFLAAHDTTAVLLTNVFFHLARNPNVYAKLRQEILQVDPKQASSEELKSLQYLWNVVSETSRLTPVVGQSARIALHDTVLPTGGGPSGILPIYVRKGTSVQFNFFALHRRPKVYGQDAGTFRPERWDAPHVGSWDFLPFGGGPRVCPAQQMALMQVRFTVARIVQNFSSIKNRDPVLEFVEQYRITSDSKNGCKVAMIPA
ncbi:MAG: hypothetical protein M1830_000767 [Pleopsidium flavum]|nr:MAG: hypothetical protein M1830_000767 [Pleopsidium flavum]